MTTQSTPFGYALTIGTASVQILPVNPSRKALMFFNPSNNTVSVCPALAPNGAALAAVVNGAGSISILSGGGFLMLPQPGWPDLGMGSAFNAVASGAGTLFTVWEF
jgi:hypothetical protein